MQERVEDFPPKWKLCLNVVVSWIYGLSFGSELTLKYLIFIFIILLNNKVYQRLCDLHGGRILRGSDLRRVRYAQASSVSRKS